MLKRKSVYICDHYGSVFQPCDIKNNPNVTIMEEENA